LADWASHDTLEVFEMDQWQNLNFDVIAQVTEALGKMPKLKAVTLA